MFTPAFTSFKIVNDIIDLKKTDLPKENQCLKIVTTNNSISSRILDVFKIDELHCVFAVIDEESVNKINQFKVKSVFARTNKEGDLLSKVANKIKCEEIKGASNHMKIFLIKSDNNFYVVNSSANPKRSDYVENYTIDNNELLFKLIEACIKAA